VEPLPRDVPDEDPDSRRVEGVRLPELVPSLPVEVPRVRPVVEPGAWRDVFSVVRLRVALASLEAPEFRVVPYRLPLGNGVVALPYDPVRVLVLPVLL
jgi:hypothetical protein